MIAVLGSVGMATVAGCTGDESADTEDDGNEDGSQETPPTEESGMTGSETQTQTRTETETQTQTQTETETRTQTQTQTPEPERVVSSFSDSWEDGDYKQDPVWFAETDNSNTVNTDVDIGVADVTSPRGSRALQYGIEWGSATATTGEKLRFDAPWTLDTMVRYPGAVQPSFYAIRFGSGGGGFFGGSDANLSINLSISEEGSEARRRATAAINGSLVEQVQQIEQILRADTWYRIQARHQGGGTYRLKLWPASDSEESAATAISEGSPPETTADNTLPLRIHSARPKGPATVQTEYTDYRTDAAADQ